MIFPARIMLSVGLAAGLGLLVLYGMKRLYDAGWNARDRIALLDMAKITGLNDQAIDAASDTFQRNSWALETEIQTLDEVLWEMASNDGYTVSIAGCGVTADGLRQLERLQ